MKYNKKSADGRGVQYHLIDKKRKVVHSRTVTKNFKIFSMMRFRIFPQQNFRYNRNQGVTKRCRLSWPSYEYMSPNAGWVGGGGGGLPDLSQRVQPCIRSPNTFGDLTPYLPMFRMFPTSSIYDYNSKTTIIQKQSLVC